MFKRHADLLESWLISREPILRDPALGDSIPHAEDLLRKHDDFLTTITAQEEAFEELKRITLLERSFQRQKETERAAKSAEKDRLEKEKIEARKRKEVQRITDVSLILFFTTFPELPTAGAVRQVSKMDNCVFDTQCRIYL